MGANQASCTRIGNGVGFVLIGDIAAIYYSKTPSVTDVLILGDWIDELAPEGELMVVQLIGANHPLPGRAAQAAGADLIRRLGVRLRVVIAYTMGDGFRAIAVRSVLRLVSMLSRSPQVMVESMDALVAQIVHHASADTPTPKQVVASLEQLMDETDASAKSA